MATTTFYRKANVSEAEATAALIKRFPKADLVSFEKKAATAVEAESAGVTEGEQIYAATIRMAEFPPKEEGGDDAGASEGGEAPEPKADESSDESSDDSDSGESPDGPPSEDGPEALGKPKKMNPQEEMVHLLHQILDALKGGAGPAGPDAGLGGPGGLDLPDVGAPGQGEGLPPAPGEAPLPPPVKEKSPMGAGAFAHYNPEAAEFTVVRKDASELGNRAMIAEAAEVFPTHKVAKIQRNGSAVVDGYKVSLPENNLAVVTFVRK